MRTYNEMIESAMQNFTAIHGPGDINYTQEEAAAWFAQWQDFYKREKAIWDREVAAAESDRKWKLILNSRSRSTLR